MNSGVYMSGDDVIERNGGESEQAEEALKYGLAVDFDYAVMNAGERIRKAFIDALDGFGVKMSGFDFISKVYGSKINTSPSGTIPQRIIGSVQVDQAAFSASLEKNLDRAVEGSAPCMWVTEMCAKFMERGGKVVLITTRSPETVQSSVERLHLEDALLLRADRHDRFGVIPVEVWNQASRMMRPRARGTLAVAVSGPSVRNAIKAGLGAAALTIPMFEYQDYSGADVFGSLYEDMSGRIFSYVSERTDGLG